jgi:2-oxoisovalerate dehydrogenase E2 component (dihydrolipoyl transacylase)
MGIFTIKMPDVGEGIAEAELVEWNVSIGDEVREDDVLAAVMTDKATVEIPSSVAGTVQWLGGDIGETIAVGADLIRIEIDGADNFDHANVDPDKMSKPIPEPSTDIEAPEPKNVPELEARSVVQARGPIRAEGEKPLAPPSVRKRAKDSGIDLRLVGGTGKAGRITHEDLDTYLSGSAEVAQSVGRRANTSVKEVRVLGLRRKIAERLANAKRRIPHITIVEEVDVTALEELRGQLNAERAADKSKLTILPFLMGAIVKAVNEQPTLNAHYDDEAEIIREFGGVHIGIATQTPPGLMVPVVRHCESRSLWECANEIRRITQAAREGSASREELSGSTITITSLGALGALSTTPIINHPEVAIVGVNRMAVRPHWNDTEFVPRMMMNLSCSFDHRIIDGWDAAIFVARLKTLLETPAMIFIEE